MKITVLGAGSWGTTLANLLSENNQGPEIFLWAREKEIIESITNERQNKLFLEGIKLASNLIVTGDIKEAVTDSEIIITAIPSQFLREKAKEIKSFVKSDVTVINVAKGLELNTFKRMSEILQEELPSSVKIVVLSGPNHAEEVSRKIPTATVIASKDADLKEIKKLFETDYFKVYPMMM